MNKKFWIYILCSKPKGTLYVGFTGDLSRRLYEHKNKLIEGFTQKHDINRIVYAESFQYVDQAIQREKCLKRWKRDWKIKLIEEHNPDWHDLYDTLI